MQATSQATPIVSSRREPVSWKTYADLLARYLKPYWGRASILGILILAGIGLQLYIPQIVRSFVDAVQAGKGAPVLLSSALLFLGTAFMRRLVTLGSTYLTADVKWRATNRLRSELARHCLRLGMSFHDRFTPGQMIERIDGDVTALSSFFSEFVLQLVANALLLMGTLVALAHENAVVGAVFAVYALLTFYFVRRTASIAVPHWTAQRQASAEMYGFLEERLAGTEDIRSSGAVAHTLAGFQQTMRDQYLSTRRASVYSTVPWAVAAVLLTLNEVAGFVLGIRLFQLSAISLGTIYLILQYNTMVRQPLEAFSRQMQDLQGATAGILRLQELFTIETEAGGARGEVGGATPPLRIPTLGSKAREDGRETPPTQTLAFEEGGETPPLRGRRDLLARRPLGVRFERLGFAYTVETPVLRDVSFTLEPGRVLGLLGRTGSGKTTIARLLFRLYEPAAGAVYLGDGVDWLDTRRASIGDVRACIGTVTQAVQLFAASVRDNLTLFAPPGDARVGDRRILDVLEDLGLAAWYRALPDGLDTQLEPNGSGLSAGQGQLLAMARLFLQDPAIVVLDEATSRLDPATERLVDRAMDRLMQGRTAIVIAHRLETVQRADRILILEDGRVLEEGERSHLVADPASYFARLLKTGLTEVLS